MEKIGERIKRRRLELKMSQEELAEKLGYTHRSTIAKIEKGVNDVSGSKIDQFATALKVSTAYLMGFEDEETYEILKKAAWDAVIATDEEAQEMIRKFYVLPDEKKKTIIQMVNDYYEAFADS